MTDNAFPQVAVVEQEFSRPRVESIEARVAECFQEKEAGLPSLRGKKVAVCAGSRGITNLAEIVRNTVRMLQKRGADPFIIPAMGSHGGGTEEGQAKILAGYGVTPEAMGVPVRSRLETVRLGETSDGVPVFMDRTAYDSDGIVLINRVKPHTDFQGEVESGLLKMITIGLGKIDGANAFHSFTLRLPHDYLILSITEVVLGKRKILFGLAIVENAYHETAHLELIPAASIRSREKELLLKAKELMPSLPVNEADILIVDRMGKDISGAGMDPNVTGRWFRINARWQKSPEITRIVALDLTDCSGGNAVGIGLADFCSQRLVDKMDRRATYLNAVTSRNTPPAYIPVHFETDRETIRQALRSLSGNASAENVRLIRIRDTLCLERMEVSKALIPELEKHSRISRIAEPGPMRFDPEGRLLPF